ncbi:TonB-dependent receptor [Halioxenophilus sp. WMMB6]|uniref:TonB-dependent receptor n=1 Tax=Halioxenophilus sp. WMMB6 TaxID=3073815 RepID=UPI00295EFF46|nr:TonB-dependent receptor [Halioxenophilus sp. WMMB6]
MTHRLNKNKLLLTTTCAAMAVGSTAVSAATIEEVIVTANKREESINDVGITVSAMSGEVIEQRLINDPVSLAQNIPGLSLAPSSHGTPVYTLRGVGYNADVLAAFPAVSIYMDEAPMQFPIFGANSVFDLERVEVLKGPQGIMFGQNSTGGAINYIAAKPTDEFEAGITASYGRWDETTLSGYVSGPLSDSVRARLAVNGQQRDEWQRNFRTGDELGKQDFFAARLIVEADLSEKLTMSMNINGASDKSDPQGKQLIVHNPAYPGLEGFINPDAATVALSPTNDARATDWGDKALDHWSVSNGRPKGDRDLSQFSVRFNYDISDEVQLVFLSTYNHLEQDPVVDLDGSYLQYTDLPKDEGHMDFYNQEIRISNANDAGAKLRWTAGANYDSGDVAEDQIITYADNSLSPANAFVTGEYVEDYRINASGIDFKADTKSWAVFGNVEYDMSEKLTLRAGARYTDSDFDTTICSYSPGDGHVANEFSLLGFWFTGIESNLSQTDCYTLNENLAPGDPYVNKLSENNTAWKVGADYRINEETLFYANISKGYKSGSFPAVTAATFQELNPATQESVLSYELGTKATLLDGAMQLNAAVFYQDYKDKQIQGALETALFGTLQQLINIPKSTIAGAEMDIVWAATDALTISTSISYLDTEVKEYTNTNLVGTKNDDHSGDKLPYAPELTFILDVDYTVPLGNGEFFAGATYNWQDEQDTYIGGSRVNIYDADNGLLRTTTDHPYVIESYSLVDARIGYRGQNGVSVSAWAKNLTDEFYVTNSVLYNEVSYQLTGLPRTYGLTVSYKF